MQIVRARKGLQRGSSLVEFALVAAVLLPLLFGTVNLGFNLSRAVQVSQIVRDIGHLYVRNLDFSLAASTDLAVRLASGLGMTANGGDGVLILSRIEYITDAQCTAGGVTVSACTNNNKAVVTQRYVIGNSSLRSSAFATPAASIVLAADDASSGFKKGEILPANYLTNSTAATTGFTSVLTGMTGGETAYLVEGYFKSVGWNFSQSYSPNTDGVYARVIF
ncbi:MAG: pilus assembly protein [Bryobacterales bacterium]|nr:pilus assembly protein [Bryobacterales bacterium]